MFTRENTALRILLIQFTIIVVALYSCEKDEPIDLSLEWRPLGIQISEDIHQSRVIDSTMYIVTEDYCYQLKESANQLYTESITTPKNVLGKYTEMNDHYVCRVLLSGTGMSLEFRSLQNITTSFELEFSELGIEGNVLSSGRYSSGVFIDSNRFLFAGFASQTHREFVVEIFIAQSGGTISSLEIGDIYYLNPLQYSWGETPIIQDIETHNNKAYILFNQGGTYTYKDGDLEYQPELKVKTLIDEDGQLYAVPMGSCPKLQLSMDNGLTWTSTEIEVNPFGYRFERMGSHAVLMTECGNLLMTGSRVSELADYTLDLGNDYQSHCLNLSESLGGLFYLSAYDHQDGKLFVRGEL